MTTSTILTDYIAHGLAAGRPVTPNVASNCLALWYSTDTNELDGWTGAAWVALTLGASSWTAAPVAHLGTTLAIHNTNTLDYAPIAATSLVGNAGTVSAIPGVIAIGANLSLSVAGTLSATAFSGATAADHGAVLNTGTVQINNVVTMAGTAAGTLTIAPGSGTSDVVVTMPTSGTVTLAAGPTFKRQRTEIDIVFGATISTPSLGPGFVFGNSPSIYVPGTVVNSIDRLMCISPDGTKYAVLAIDQGFTI